ncbi:MAG: ATP-binding protein [Haliscomenobacter sp.]|nr:ATP-binding protein [Haliscomenobacter sp.]
MKRRFFNTTGLCTPEDHYMVNPFRTYLEDIMRLIEAKQYFVIHAPRQTGKTTFLHSLAHRLNQEGTYVATVCSLESAGYPSISVEDANMVFVKSMHRIASVFLEAAYMPPLPSGYTASPSLLGDYLTDWCKALSKPLVLLLDEVDALYDDVLISTLRQLRDGFQTRPRHFPQSVALVGLRDIREYRLRARRIIRRSGRDRRLMSRLSPFFSRFSPGKRYVRCWISIPRIPGRFLQRLFLNDCTPIPADSPG